LGRIADELGSLSLKFQRLSADARGFLTIGRLERKLSAEEQIEKKNVALTGSKPS